MKILIFEHAFRISGHRLPYASLVAEAFRDHEVTVALPSALADEPELDQYFRDATRLFYETNVGSTWFGNASESLRCLRSAIGRVTPDHVCVPTADGMAVIAGLKNLLNFSKLFPVPIHIALMIGVRPREAVKGMGGLSNCGKWWLIRKGPWNDILLTDERAYLEQRGLGPRVQLSPDPVPERSTQTRLEARRKLGIASDCRLLVSAGNQDSRKGVDQLVKHYCRGRRSDRDRLLLIGRLSDSVREVIENMPEDFRGQALIVRDQFVSEGDFSNALLAADLVATAYQGTQRPSGIVSRCIAWGIPVLASDKGWLRWVLERYQAGYRIDASSEASFSESIFYALDRCCEFRKSDAAVEFGQFNNQANYMNVWRRLVLGKDNSRIGESDGR